jgi:hypothetical protein
MFYACCELAVTIFSSRTKVSMPVDLHQLQRVALQYAVESRSVCALRAPFRADRRLHKTQEQE